MSLGWGPRVQEQAGATSVQTDVSVLRGTILNQMVISEGDIPCSKKPKEHRDLVREHTGKLSIVFASNITILTGRWNKFIVSPSVAERKGDGFIWARRSDIRT
jgi:hypothetical protein